MKTVPLAPLLLAFQILPISIGSGTIKEADYPMQYEVMNTSKSSKFVVQKVCSMTLHEQAATDAVLLNVARPGYGTCHVLDNGKMYRGRQNPKKNAIELVIPVGETKARVEDWQIVGTVNTSPK